MRALQDIPLKELIPQRPPFVMIDKMMSFNMTVTETQLEVRADNVFCKEGRLTAEGLMENIAQTCAARMGYINLINNEAVKIGVIGSVNNYEVFRTPKVGEVILTSIEVIEEMFQITMVKAVVKCGDEMLAQSNMKIALMDIESQD
ncbi:MAG: pseudouridylate synthase [Bacteroidales bacterium]|nr:pseudouridylate synthase [Bacteroidales bacterium]